MPGARPTGLRLIILYKRVKGALQLALAVALVGLAAFGWADRLADFAVALRDHMTHAGTYRLAELLVRATTSAHIEIVALVLALDGAFTLVEGWALASGRRWGPWLVVVATSALLPFEIAALVRGVRAGRLVLLIVNVAIVAYLARRARMR